MRTADQAATAWEQSSTKAQTNWAAGVDGYQGDWAAATTRQEGALLQNVTQAIQNGTWRNGVNRVGTNGWKTATKASTANFANGFTKGAAAQRAAIAKILAAEANIVASAPPRGTYEQNKARATYVMDQLHALRGTLGA